MSAACPRCSAVLLDENQECTNCLQEETETSLIVAKGRAEQVPAQPQVDAFAELESSLKSVKAARAIVDDLVDQLHSLDVVERAKAMQTVMRAVSSLGTCTSKLSKEALVWQEKRHKVAQAMSVEDEMVRVQRWFNKKLTVYQMRALVESLIASYNERKKSRDQKNQGRPWKDQ